MIRYPRESVFSILKFEYLSENQTKIENILTHWSVAQAGSNGELNWRLKISLDCPFKCHICYAGHWYDAGGMSLYGGLSDYYQASACYVWWLF